jgi:hypothetical protein
MILCLWHLVDNIELLHLLEMAYLMGDQHSCPQTTECYTFHTSGVSQDPLKLASSGQVIRALSFT